jgi:HSP20 family protein
MLMRFDPFRQLENVTQVLNRQAAAMRAQSMPMDAYREGDRFIVKFDLAGIDPSSIDLTVERNEVTVSAERSWEPTEEQQVVIAERPQGKFTRQLFLGDSLDVDNIQASYEHGVLTLEIPVSEQAKPRKIEVSASEGTETVPAGSST